MEDTRSPAPTGRVLLVCDLQNDILVSLSASTREEVVSNNKRLLDGARAAGITVIFVGVCFREGYPEVNLNNKLYRGIREAKALLDGTIGAQFEDSLQPLPSEPVVVKKRVSAHYGTELPLLLQTMRASEVIMAGVSTSGVILSTVRWLADADFSITVIRDCCADRDNDVHTMLCNKVFPRQAAVRTVEDFLRSVQPKPSVERSETAASSQNSWRDSAQVVDSTAPL